MYLKAPTSASSHVHVSVVCPMAPLKIPHGARIDGIQNQTVYHLGDEVEYQCERGDEYNLNYSDPISCTNDGTWNPYIPSCNLGNMNMFIIPSCNLGNMNMLNAYHSFL